jgi:hypothetical protein
MDMYAINCIEITHQSQLVAVDGLVQHFGCYHNWMLRLEDMYGD